MTASIVAEELTKWYGPRLAVDRVSLEVRPGEVMGLLGPNGSGKTTILRILTGYLRPSAGTVRIAGVDMVDAPLETRRRIGYVPEDVPLYDWMRVAEFLAFMARVKGVAPEAVRDASDQVVQRLALGEVVRLPVGKLSRGFRQRVAIAQALLGDPPVLILDEPANGLDPRQIIELRELVRALAGSHTILVTSHILAEMERVADRVAILLGGRLLAVHELRRRDAPRRLRLRARAPADALRACLNAVAGLRSVRVEPASSGDGVSAVVEVDGAGAAEALAAAVAASGLPLLELGEERVDLETVFLGLTGGAPSAPIGPRTRGPA